MPSMTDDEQAALLASIRLFPYFVMVIVYAGKILDGWRRLQACIEAAIRPKFFFFTGDDPVVFVQQQNLARRHLSLSRKAVSVVVSRKWAPRGRPRNAAPNAEFSTAREPSFTDAQMAMEGGVSVRLIQGAKVVHEAGMQDQVLSGRLSIRKTLLIIAAQKHEQQPASGSQPEPIFHPPHKRDTLPDDEALEEGRIHPDDGKSLMAKGPCSTCQSDAFSDLWRIAKSWNVHVDPEPPNAIPEGDRSGPEPFPGF